MFAHITLPHQLKKFGFYYAGMMAVCPGLPHYSVSSKFPQQHTVGQHQTLFKQPFLNPCWALQNKLFFNQFDTAARSLAPPPTVSNTLCSHYQYRFPVNVKIYIAYIKQQASTFIIIIQYVL